MELIEFINLAIGVPFLDQGRDFHGWDCWGLIRRAYRDCFGIELPDLNRCTVLSYEQGRELFDSLAVAYREVDLALAQPGDVVILRGVPCHAGLVVQPGLMLHVDMNIDTCVEPYATGAWKTRVIGIYRHADCV
jgi:cell wall-associated NlpC family hydrolase